MTNDNSAGTEELVAELREQNRQQQELLQLLKEKHAPRDPNADGEGEAMTIDIKSIFLALLRYWWLILLATILCAALTAFVCYRNYTPTYTATAKMYVNNDSVKIGTTKVSITSSDLSAAQSLVQTYCEILKTRLTLKEVISQLEEEHGYQLDYYGLLSKIGCGAVNETEIFYISITDSDPERAINIVNKIVDVLPYQIATVIDGSSVRTVDKAEDAKLINPGFTKKIAVGALVGFVFACGYAFLRGCIFNDLVEDETWLKEQYPTVPVLAEIPDATTAHTGHRYGKYGYKSYSYASSYENKEKGRGE